MPPLISRYKQPEASITKILFEFHNEMKLLENDNKIGERVTLIHKTVADLKSIILKTPQNEPNKYKSFKNK